ncbi:MAG: hypothetical protein PHZ09_06565 [Eubacteriales bacterium]|nr:hypothetical protein [Eubacteriales bacterium]
MKINIIKAIIISLAAVILVSCGSSAPVVMSYKNSEITANMYSYWLSTYKSDFLYFYNNSMEDDDFWNSEVSQGVTSEQFAENLINENIKYILIGMQLFRDYNLKITAETTASINEDINEKIDYYGGRANLNTALSAYGINIDILRDIYIAEEKLYAVYDYLYGENGIDKVTEAMLDKYYTENYSRIKYIIIYTKEKNMYDEEGQIKYDSEGLIMTEALSEEELEEKAAKINEVMICVNAGDEFEDIMADYNEADMSQYPNGFYISANELSIYGFTMINAVKNMKIGEIRQVEDENAVYIIKKYDLIDRSDFDNSDSIQLDKLETYAIQEKYENTFSHYAVDIIINDEVISDFSVRTAAPNSLF